MLMYSEEDRLIQQPVLRTKGVSIAFVVGILAVGVFLGFTLGLFSSDSLGDTRVKSTILYDEDLVTSLFEKASPAIVEIQVLRRTARLGLTGVGTGSGFLVGRDGTIVTNHHVVDGADQVTVRLSDGRTLEATKLGTSPADDLALLKVDPEEVADISPLTLADSDKVKPGQMALAVGSPFQNFNSITVGVVSGTGRGPASVLRRPIPDMIQTDAPLNPGNSGGPLLNSKGEVMGVNSSVRLGRDRGIEEFRIGFAVPSNTLIDLIPVLLESRVVRRPWLGISGGSVTADLRSSLGLPKGIYVAGVFSDSPAEQAGLVPFLELTRRGQGDVITAVDGEPVSSMEEMVSHLNTLDPGNQVMLSVYRGERTVEIEVTLVEWPDT